MVVPPKKALALFCASVATVNAAPNTPLPASKMPSASPLQKPPTTPPVPRAPIVAVAGAPTNPWARGLPVGTSWLNRAWAEARHPNTFPDQGQKAVTLNMYNGLTPAEVHSYRKNGRYVICYTSGGMIFAEEMKKYPTVPTQMKVDDGYNGNRWWLDITQPLSKLAPLIDAKLAEAKKLGCNAMEWDNVDCWEYDKCHSKYRTIQHPTMRTFMVQYLEWLAARTHAAGLQVGLKNEATLVVLYPKLADIYDFSVVENCNTYCDPFMAFIKRGKAVLMTQHVSFDYGVKSIASAKSPLPLIQWRACQEAQKRKFTLLVDLNRTGWKPCNL